MTAMTGHLRKGQMCPALTGRALRRYESRAQARTEQRPGRPVIGHMDRAIVAARNANAGLMTVGEFLHGIGFPEADRLASAFGRACAKAYRTNHDAEPQRLYAAVNGRIRRSQFGYTDAADLLAGARARRGGTGARRLTCASHRQPYDSGKPPTPEGAAMGAILEATRRTKPFSVELRRESFWVHRNGTGGDGASADKDSRKLVIPAGEVPAFTAALEMALKQVTPIEPGAAQWDIDHGTDGAVTISGPWAMVTHDVYKATRRQYEGSYVHGELLYGDAAALIAALRA